MGTSKHARLCNSRLRLYDLFFSKKKWDELIRSDDHRWLSLLYFFSALDSSDSSSSFEGSWKIL